MLLDGMHNPPTPLGVERVPMRKPGWRFTTCSPLNILTSANIRNLCSFERSQVFTCIAITRFISVDAILLWSIGFLPQYGNTEMSYTTWRTRCVFLGNVDFGWFLWFFRKFREITYILLLRIEFWSEYALPALLGNEIFKTRCSIILRNYTSPSGVNQVDGYRLFPMKSWRTRILLKGWSIFFKFLRIIKKQPKSIWNDASPYKTLWIHVWPAKTLTPLHWFKTELKGGVYA